jgi:signal transduction histidine kinase
VLDVTNTGSAGSDKPGERGGHATDGRSLEGRGVRGMRERANAYDGTLDVGPTEDGGWRVHLSLHTDTQPVVRRLEAVL